MVKKSFYRVTIIMRDGASIHRECIAESQMGALFETTKQVQYFKGDRPDTWYPISAVNRYQIEIVDKKGE